MIARPSRESSATGSTSSPSASAQARSRELAVDPGGDHRGAGGRPAGSVRHEQGPGGRARFHHLLAAGEGDAKLLG